MDGMVVDTSKTQRYCAGLPKSANRKQMDMIFKLN